MSTATSAKRKTIRIASIKPPNIPVPIDENDPKKGKTYKMIAVHQSGQQEELVCSDRVWRLTRRPDFNMDKKVDFNLVVEDGVVVDIQKQARPLAMPGFNQEADNEAEAHLLTLQKSGNAYTPKHVPKNCPQSVVDDILNALGESEKELEPGDLVCEKYEFVEQRKTAGLNLVLINPQAQ